MASLLSWAGNQVKRLENTVHNDVAAPIQRAAGSVVHNTAQTVSRNVANPIDRGIGSFIHQLQGFGAQANPVDGGRTYHTVMDRGAQYAPKPNQSVVHQATHNGLTNVTGGLAKGAVAPFDYLGRTTIVNPIRELTAQATHNPVAYQHAVRQSNIDLGLGANGKNIGQGLRKFAGESAQAGLTVAAPGVGKAIDKSFAAVAPKIVPKLVTRTIANAGTGAVVGAPFNVANTISSDQPLTVKNLKNSAVQGAQFGAVLGAGGTLAGAAAPVVAKGAVKIAKKAPEAVTPKPIRQIDQTIKQYQKAFDVETNPTRRKQISQGIADLNTQRRNMAEGGYVKNPLGSDKPTDPLAAADKNTNALLNEFTKLRQQHGNDAAFYDKVVLNNVETPGKIGQLSRSIARNVEGGGADITQELDHQLAPLNRTAEASAYKTASLTDLKQTARQLERDTGQKGLYTNLAKNMAGMTEDQQIAYLSKGLTEARQSGAMAAAHVNRESMSGNQAPPEAKGAAPQVGKTAKGFILKEGPIQNGKQDVIRAVRNPQTGHLEAVASSITAPTHRGMSTAELASLDRTVGQSDLQRGASTLERPTSPPSRLPAGRLAPIDTGAFPSRPSETPAQSAGIPSSLDRQRLTNIEKTSSAPIVPEDIAAAKEHNTYPVKRKVNAIDYLRTPEKVLNKLGLKQEAQALRVADHNYKQQLPKEIDKIKGWRDAVGNSQESNQKIFQWLDGKKVSLNPTEAKVAGEMRGELNKWADRLHIPEEGRISNYITHIFDQMATAKEFDPELEKLIKDKVPGSVYDPFTMHRTGAEGYKQDAFQAMQAYVKRAVRKANFDPALEHLSSAAEGLDTSGYDFVKRYGDRINMRPMELDNLIDNFVKQTPVGYKLGQRPVAVLSGGIRQATFRASLGLNFGSAVRNLTQGVNTFAELGTKWTGVGYTKALESIAKHSDELHRVGVLDNSMIEDRVLSASKQALQKADKGLFAFFEAAEKVNRGAAYYGAKAKALSEGKPLEDAIQAGVDASRKTQFTFGRVDTPVALQGDLVKLFTQFQSYNVKQAEFLGEMIKNKEFAKLLRFTGASAVVFLTVGRALGYKPSDMVPSAQIGQAPAFKVLPAVKDAIVSSVTAKDNSNTSRGKQIEKAWMKAGGAIGSAAIPGFVQGKKTVTGVNAVNAGQVKKGSKVVLVNKSKGNYVKGALFGPYSLNGTPAANRETFDGKQVVLPNDQRAQLDKQIHDKERTLDQQLKDSSGYKSLTPDKQASKLKALNSQITTAEKRDFASTHGYGQFAQDYKGKQIPINKTQQSILQNNYKPDAKSTGTKSSTKDQISSGAKQSQKGIYQVKGKDGSTKYSTLQGENYHNYKSLDDAKVAQAKNIFKYSNKQYTTINGQQYHKSTEGNVIKGAPKAPSAPTASNTTYDPKSNTWTRVSPMTGKTVQIASDGSQTVLSNGIGHITNARPDYVTNILTSAKKHGVDPYAAMAVAAAEGLGGGVGDNGTSFGPFQLHVGGALPQGKNQAWAESPAGIDYAMQRISQVAKGKKGQEAIQAIVSQFERPTDPNGEIARALDVYGGGNVKLTPGQARGGQYASVKKAATAQKKVAATIKKAVSTELRTLASTNKAAGPMKTPARPHFTVKTTATPSSYKQTALKQYAVQKTGISKTKRA